MMDTPTSRPAAVHAQYERWPYPDIALAASVRSADVWQLHLDHLRDRAGMGPGPERPRLWIAGCGTFQPYVFGVANPRAKVLATDISATSLRTAWARCRLHGQWRTAFATVDLNRPDTWPEGPFDFIECYGVLMNLDDPAATLRALAARLAPDGLLRLMVYPHFSRQRVFQVQRLAKVLGFHAGHPAHPRRFRSVIAALPEGHPLRFAFDTYTDARTDAGLVDGFLHAGDHGFTGLELGQLANQAGLAARAFFHRPWGQPGHMASLLSLEGHSWAFLLHYLDLWQHLRGNFIVVFTRDDAPKTARPTRLHPAVDSLRARWFGFDADSRIHRDGIRWTARDLATLRADLRRDTLLRHRGGEEGIVFGVREPEALGVPDEPVVAPRAPLALGYSVPNPLYAHIFDAYRFHRQLPGFLDLAEQLDRWRGIADPLEDDAEHFGLTPYGTWRYNPDAMEAYATLPEEPRVARYDQLRFSDEREGLPAARAFVDAVPHAREAFDEVDLREIWRLTGGARALLVDAAPT